MEPAPLSTFARPPPDKYATIRTGGKYDKSHKYAQQMEEESAAAQQPACGTLDRKSAAAQRRINNANQMQHHQRSSEKTGNGTSIVHQPLPDPPALAPQPLSAAHFAQYRSPAPPALPCCNQGNQQSQHRSQNRSGRTPEKFFSTSSQQPVRPPSDQRGQTRQSYSHTLDRRHAHSAQNAQQNQSAQIAQAAKMGTQTLDRRSRQNRAAPLDNQHQPSADANNKDLYAVTEL